jgi:pyruvate dehydrogenase E1 component alpha subunit
MYDGELYRGKEEVEQWKQRDPITTFIARLREQEMLDDDSLASIEADVSAEVSDAVAFAERAPLEPVEDLLKDVYTLET